MENEQLQGTPPSDLTVTDLQNIRSIIDAASRRGAFAASEMAAIGTVYNKLDQFINSVAPQPQEENK